MSRSSSRCWTSARSPTQYSIGWRHCWMDAREALRRYLEQRRDLGESELVLDSLSVDEARRLLGAAGRGSSADATERSESASSAAPRTASAASADVTDWREAVRAAGGGPSEKKPMAGKAEGPPPGARPAPKAAPPSAPVASDAVHVPSTQSEAAVGSPLEDVQAG